MFFSSSVFAQDVSTTNKVQDSTRNMLEAAQNLNDSDVQNIIELLAQKVTSPNDSAPFDNYVLSQHGVVDEKGTTNKYNGTPSAVSSDNWQVVRIIAVASADSPLWDMMSRYDSTTSENHGGNWLLVATEELAFQPLFGNITATGKFRFWNATEIVSSRVNISNSIYTGFQRYWVVENNITSGEFKFEAKYSNSTGVVRLHRELNIR